MTLLQAKGLLHTCPAQDEPRLQRSEAFLADEPRAVALGWYEGRRWRVSKRSKSKEFVPMRCRSSLFTFLRARGARLKALVPKHILRRRQASALQLREHTFQ